MPWMSRRRDKSMISIIIPSVRSNTVVDTITAIIAQSDTDWELIISDQSGNDGLLPVLEGFADPRIRRLKCPGRGAALARDFGLVHASGSIIAFTDDDCRPRKDWIATIRRLFDEDPDLWMATGSLTSPTGEMKGVFFGVYISPERRARPSEGGGHIYSVTANAAYRRIAFEKAGPFDICFSPGTQLNGGEEDDHGQRMELFDPVFRQTPLLEVEHTHGMRLGVKAVWGLKRKYSISVGALAAKRTLLHGDGAQFVRQEVRLAVANVFRQSPMGTLRSAFRAYFIRQGYYYVLKNYQVDKALRLLVPRGADIHQLYAPVADLLNYCLPAEAKTAAQFSQTL